MSLIYKKLLEINKKTPTSIGKIGKGYEQFPEKEVQLALKHIKRCSTTLIMRRIQIPFFIFQTGKNPEL